MFNLFVFEKNDWGWDGYIFNFHDWGWDGYIFNFHFQPKEKLLKPIWVGPINAFRSILSPIIADLDQHQA